VTIDDQAANERGANSAGANRPEAQEPPLKVSGLHVTVRTGSAELRILRGVSFEVLRGQMLALIGESGAGKSTCARAIMGLLPPDASTEGSVRVDDQELVGLGERELSHVRGRDVAMVFQDPQRSLNPTKRVGAQIVEALRIHLDLSRQAARERALELMSVVRLPSPRSRFDDYPHQLSGGMRQRVMIAMALACDPKVLIADEATSALDVTTQAQIMDLLAECQQRYGLAVVLVSHDLGLAAEYADAVAVMYAGTIVEAASAERLFSSVQMPYTHALLDAVPSLEEPAHALIPVRSGIAPDPANLPAGCPFSPRCPVVEDRCLTAAPRLEEVREGHRVACWRPGDWPEGGEG
jgi:oligopeptide/dipeptide ABC transporter ATP-binding protein